MFNVFDNCLSGSFPAALLRLKELQELNIAANNFTGSLPGDLAEASYLKSLILFDNNFQNQSEFQKLLNERPQKSDAIIMASY